MTSDWRTDGIHCREVAAGNDIKMPYGSDERLIKDVHDGYLSMEDVDTSARRVLELFLKLA